jgi:hypothetical protein
MGLERGRAGLDRHQAVYQPIEVVPGRGQSVCANVTEHVVGAINVNLTVDERMKPTQHRARRVSVEFRSGRSVEDRARDEQGHLRRLGRRRADDVLVEHALLDRRGERIAHALVNLVPGDVLGVER